MKRTDFRFSLLGLALACLSLAGCETTSSSKPSGPAAVGAAPLPTYSPTGDYLQGNLRLGAPASLAPYLTEAATQFKRIYWGAYTDLTFPTNVAGEFVAGKVSVAANTRPLTQEERDAFTQRFNGPPLEVRIGQEPIDVFVNTTNPVVSLNMTQLAQIFGYSQGTVSTWGQVGVGSGWSSYPISPIVGNPAWELPRAFQAIALQGGPFNNRVQFSDSPNQVVQRVQASPGAIGLGNARLSGGSVKPVAIEVRGSRHAVYPSRENMASGAYPLRTFYYLYINPRSRPMDPLVREFARMTLSQEAVGALSKTGAMPLDGRTAQEGLNQISAFDGLR
jgi:ABC-type phosphate transport system substrate-binding protein